MAMREPAWAPTVRSENLVAFFELFSRFEYALKRAGYVELNREGVASVNWVKFKDELRDDGVFRGSQPPRLRQAIAYLEAHPPKKQTLNGWQMLDWEPLDTDGYGRAARLMLYIRTVRNNLFHGGKYSSGPVSDPARDDDLLAAATVVIEAILEASPKVAEAFDDQ